MKQKILLILLFFPFILTAQDYRVSLIPDSLKVNANAIKRIEEIHVLIKGIDKAIVKSKCAYTILNEAGEKFAYYSNYYDKFRSLSDITGRMFDADGKLLKSIKRKDISDVSVNDEESMVTDARTKRFAFYNKRYPYTVEFEDEMDFNGIFNLPTWIPVIDQQLSIQKSSFSVETPVGYQLRYKQFNFVVPPGISNNSKTILYTWKLENKNAVLFEPYQPVWHEITPAVYIAPTDFVFGGHTGNMSNWNDLGKFEFGFFEGRDVLPDNVKQEVHQLTDKLSSREERVKVLYKYMQQNTRFISIQLGIGGLQPFDAKFVAEKKYGDCKALSNYMVGLLKEAGIKANCVVIKSGEGVEGRGLFEDFPVDRFDHVITCVPDIKDTLWLECTSQVISAGYMGRFTGNRKALLISETGGYIVNTPAYTASDNLQLRKINASIDVDGNLVAEVHTHFTGLQQDLQHDLLYTTNKEEREKYLNTVLNIPTYKVEKNEYEETKARIPVINEYLKITSANYASVTGKRLFIAPNLFNRESKLSEDMDRKFDIEFRYSYKDVDTIFIKIPPGFVTESIPKGVNIINKFGNYSISYKVLNDTIELLRIHEQNAATFPASDYKELVTYIENMYRADRARIVLIKKEG